MHVPEEKPVRSAGMTAARTSSRDATRGPILIVEDDPEICELLRSVLRLEHLPAVAAASGPAALSLARSERPSLVLLDLELPGLSGEAIANRLRAMYGPSLPIVVVSASIDAAAVAKRIGALACLIKPFELDDLLGAVHRALRCRRPG